MRKVDVKNLNNIYKKWSPIINNYFKNDNRLLVEIISLYCEWYSSDNTFTGSNELPEKLINIKNKINSFDRVEIVGKYHNKYTGLVEYKLVNGEFISINSPNDYELSFDEKIEIFGIEFIRDLDPTIFRDTQLDKIL